MLAVTGATLSVLVGCSDDGTSENLGGAANSGGSGATGGGASSGGSTSGGGTGGTAPGSGGAAGDTGTGGDPGTGGTGGGTAKMCEMGISLTTDKHTHFFKSDVPQADIDAGVDKTYVVSGTHEHMITITSADWTTLKSTGTVMIMISGGHDHVATVTCDA